MKFMTFDAGNGPRVGLVNGTGVVDLTKHAGATSLRGLIADDKIEAMAAHAGDAPDHALDDVIFLPVIPDPAHIWCVGVNYMDHLQEAIDAGLPRSKSEHPMIFGRYADTMVGHKQNLMKSPVVEKLDYECELAVIIGKAGRHISKENALSHVAGYSCINEGSARDWQYHTSQVVPGKNFARTCGFGPWMVTADEIPDPQVLDISTVLNGKTMQDANTKDMIFDVATVIAYVSNFSELQPGDVIASGTPSGVGQSREPQVFMQPGDVCEIHIENVGTLINEIAEG
ncbi:MAG: 2-keto-4-pentenoate hydratase/2-oxohepta-3-ene-1,7-dioic acid hydratase in catechol pathway [Paracoccaceae bacterium]|jgi:2-keto-4-pentenoate hydratase/2-oxohepta-3-ene-1,7-dioic acid hydratase in catechol pathway